MGYSLLAPVLCSLLESTIDPDDRFCLYSFIRRSPKNNICDSLVCPVSFLQRDHLELVFCPEDRGTRMAHHDVQHFGKNPALPAFSQGVYTSHRTDQQKPVSPPRRSLARQFRGPGALCGRRALSCVDSLACLFSYFSQVFCCLTDCGVDLPPGLGADGHAG